jgi:hypothetical protein
MKCWPNRKPTAQQIKDRQLPLPRSATLLEGLWHAMWLSDIRLHPNKTDHAGVEPLTVEEGDTKLRSFLCAVSTTLLVPFAER